eukprot:TRINITY_DN2389_c0_g1_i1.p1 TRINITY_DN2389_c0_g1~~TRINITY_DN2389_c0_g1_i1.p1  ORF type:complete len:556 (+),score=130.03 TRINITY_DN2389_c0_g1_i1:257-1924(+)
MFPGMFDPDMMRAAQEQMSKMTPEDLQRMQQMMTPEMTRMAMDNMQNMRPEQVKQATEQMKSLTPEQLASMGNMGAGGGFEQANVMMQQQRNYQISASVSLKNQGNRLHGEGNYTEAAEKYTRATANLAGHTSPEAAALIKSCTLNLMLCGLKTKKWKDVVQLGSEVLALDSANVKALYRRGQAFKEMGRKRAAVKDLERASKLSPDDETIASYLRQARLELAVSIEAEASDDEEEDRSGDAAVGPSTVTGVEDISERPAGAASRGAPEATPSGSTSGGGGLGSASNGPFRNAHPTSSLFPGMDPAAMQAQMAALSQNPAMIRQMQTMMSQMDPETIARLSGGAVTPEVARMANETMKNLAPEQIESMIKMNAAMASRPSSSAPAGASAAAAPSTILGGGSAGVADMGALREGPSSSGASPPMSSFPSMPFGGAGGMPELTPEIQRQMAEQMKSPETMKAMHEMMKSMSPEMMAQMSEQASGKKMSVEQARQAQEAFAKLSPQEVETLMKLASRAQQAMGVVRRCWQWVAARPMVIFALIFLLVAVLLRSLGYIG